MNVEFQSAIAAELFRRTRFSAAVGIIGVAIMTIPHLPAHPMQLTAAWTLCMAALLMVRFLHATKVLQRLDRNGGVGNSIQFETTLCCLIGIGWGSSVFLFDTSQMDQAFYVRLMILAGAMAFVVPTTAAVIQVFFAYCLPVGLIVLTSLLLQADVQPKGIFVMSISLYMVMLVGQAYTIHRSVRQGISSRLAAARLTQSLNEALVTERTLREEIQQLSLTDELTGVFNRRGATSNLEVELARARRLGTPLSLLVIDIDRFKPINDTHGHATGDEVIRTVVESLKKELRETDVVGRIGGDEFIVVLPALELEGALSAAHRLRQSVQFSSVDLQARGISVTISVGVATFRPSDSIAQLMSRADDALYVAKANGRNRIEPENRPG